MLLPRRQRFYPHGGLLAVALVMTLLGGLFLAGWVSLCNARAMQARNSEISAQRRLMLENSKAYIRQMVLERAFSGNSTVNSNVEGETGASWGALNTGTGWNNLKIYDLPPEISYPETGYYTSLFPYNLLSQRPGASFLSVQKMLRPASYNGVTHSAMDPFNAYQFIKGVFPCLSGDGMVVYRKPDGDPREIFIPNFYIKGRLVVRDPASFYNSADVNLTYPKRLTTRVDRYYVQKFDERNPVHATNKAGNQQVTQNLPSAPSTFGPFPAAGGGAPTTKELFRGELNIVRNTYVPAGLPADVTHNPNCLWQIQTREATSTPVRAAVATISSGTSTGTPADAWWISDESAAPTYPPPAYPSGYGAGFQVLFIRLNHPDLPNLRIYPVVQQVVFLGQETSSEYNLAADLDPRIILFVPLPSGQSFKDVRFIRENNRPMVLGMQAHHTGEPIEFYWVPPNVNSSALTIDWRMILINEGRQVSFYRPSGSGGGPDSVIMTGGILTNWSMERRVGSAADTGQFDKITIVPESTNGYSASYKLASILPREFWLESYFQLQ